MNCFHSRLYAPASLYADKYSLKCLIVRLLQFPDKPHLGMFLFCYPGSLALLIVTHVPFKEVVCHDKSYF